MLMRVYEEDGKVTTTAFYKYDVKDFENLEELNFDMKNLCVPLGLNFEIMDLNLTKQY